MNVVSKHTFLFLMTLFVSCFVTNGSASALVAGSTVSSNQNSTQQMQFMTCVQASTESEDIICSKINMTMFPDPYTSWGQYVIVTSPVNQSINAQYDRSLPRGGRHVKCNRISMVCGNGDEVVVVLKTAEIIAGIPVSTFEYMDCIATGRNSYELTCTRIDAASPYGTVAGWGHFLVLVSPDESTTTGSTARSLHIGSPIQCNRLTMVCDDGDQIVVITTSFFELYTTGPKDEPDRVHRRFFEELPRFELPAIGQDGVCVKVIVPNMKVVFVYVAAPQVEVLHPRLQIMGIYQDAIIPYDEFIHFTNISNALVEVGVSGTKVGPFVIKRQPKY